MRTETKLIESKSKTIIIENDDKSYVQSCNSEEQRFFQELMKNEEISYKYGSGIFRALQRVPWLEFRPKDLSINRMQGFYKDDIRHPLSYLAGNYRAFCMITKSVNALLKKNGKEPIILRNKTVEEQIKAVEKLVDLIKHNSSKIFDESSSFYLGIISNLGGSKEKGERIEKITEERLKSEFGEKNVSMKSGFGLESDSKGTDGEIFFDGNTYTLQIKPFTTNFIEDNKMVVLTTGKLLKYTQDLMVFTNSTETLVFLNNNTELGIDAYKFPPDDLIYTLT